MPPFKNPSIRRLFTRAPLPARFHQRRWARVNDVRFHATQGAHAQERIFDRYRDKLSRKAKEQGLNDVGTLREAYKDKIETLRKEALRREGSIGAAKVEAKQSPSKEAFSGPPPPAPAPAPAPVTAGTVKKSGLSGVKTLSSFIDVEKTLELPQKEIEYIWRLRHSNSPSSLCAIIPAEVYAHIALMAQKHPQFILPLPREHQGAEIHFLQWTFPHPHTATVLFTHLAEYKLRGEYASPHTTVSLHTELADAKGLVLAQGNVQDERGITVEEGKWLLMCLQKFYGVQASERTERRRLLEQFTSGDSSFKVQELLDEAERIG